MKQVKKLNVKASKRRGREMITAMEIDYQLKSIMAKANRVGGEK